MSIGGRVAIDGPSVGAATAARLQTGIANVSNEKMKAQMSTKDGFIAALDQSGGSTPGALRQYGIEADSYSGDEAMFALMHEMRVRIIKAPAFTGEKVLGAILFERTMDGDVDGKPVPSYLWEDRGVVPFLKMDKGLEAESDSVQMMKPMPGLDDLLARAVKLGVYGTKMRSVIAGASKSGVDAIVAQQFEVARQISKHGLMPIIEPEVSIKSPTKGEAEAELNEALTQHLDQMGEGKVMLKLTIPDEAELYRKLTTHKNVERVVALSGGYKLDDACERLSRNHGMIASFSRALIDSLKQGMLDDEFNSTLSSAIDKIYAASAYKVSGVNSPLRA